MTNNSHNPSPISDTLTSGLSKVKHIILVLSGKGGVGKSSITTQIALSLATQPHPTTGSFPTVGILDIDLCGPSIPRMMGIDNTAAVLNSPLGWVPYQLPSSTHVIKIMSIGFLLPNKDDAVIWRGPKKTAMIHQFINDVNWDQCDYLVIDTPPGTSDEHIAIMEALRPFNNKSAIIVTTPQMVALSDVRKEISFCHKVKLPIIGIIENMSGYRCPHCSDCTNIFSTGGGQKLAIEFNVPYLGNLPIDPTFATLVDSLPTNSDSSNQVVSLLDVYPGTPMASEFVRILHNIMNNIEQNS